MKKRLLKHYTSLMDLYNANQLDQYPEQLETSYKFDVLTELKIMTKLIRNRLNRKPRNENYNTNYKLGHVNWYFKDDDDTVFKTTEFFFYYKYEII